MFFAKVLAASILTSIAFVAAAPTTRSPNTDLPPLIEGEVIPDAYLIRAGFDLDVLYNREPSGNSTSSNFTELVADKDAATVSVCQVSPHSPNVFDAFDCVQSLPQGTTKCVQRNEIGSQCTTMKTYKSAAIGICGNQWNGLCSILYPYLEGIVSSCESQADGMIDLSQGYQQLNTWDTTEDAPYVKLIVFHS